MYAVIGGMGRGVDPPVRLRVRVYGELAEHLSKSANPAAELVRLANRGMYLNVLEHAVATEAIREDKSRSGSTPQQSAIEQEPDNEALVSSEVADTRPPSLDWMDAIKMPNDDR